MATNRDIVTDALKLLNVVEAAGTATPEDARDALTALSDMVASWEGRSVYHGQAIGELADLFPFEDKHVRGVKALLAVEIAGSYGKTPRDFVVKNALEGWLALQADYGVSEELRVDRALQNMPSQRRGLR